MISPGTFSDPRDLLQFLEEKLQQRYGINTGTWLWNIARGISGEEVQGRLLPKSHGSGKTFPGPQALRTISTVQQWLNELCEELSERLHSDMDQNKRIAHTLTLHARAYKKGDANSHKKFPSKSCPLRYGTRKIQEDALTLFNAGLRDFLGSYNCKTHGSESNNWGITSLSVSASKIVPIPSGLGQFHLSGCHMLLPHLCFWSQETQCVPPNKELLQKVGSAASNLQTCISSIFINHVHNIESSSFQIMDLISRIGEFRCELPLDHLVCFLLELCLLDVFQRDH